MAHIGQESGFGGIRLLRGQSRLFERDVSAFALGDVTAYKFNLRLFRDGMRDVRAEIDGMNRTRVRVYVELTGAVASCKKIGKPRTEQFLLVPYDQVAQRCAGEA